MRRQTGFSALLAGLVALLSGGAAGAVQVALVRGPDITACAYCRDGAGVLFSWKHEGGEIRRIAVTEADPEEPAYAQAAEVVTAGLDPVPFLDKLLFVRRGSERGGLWVRDLPTGTERQLRRDPFVGLPAAVSGDGAVVMVSRHAGKSKRIGIVDLTSGKYRSIPGQDMSQPALNGTGSRLLFVRAGQIWLRELGSGQESQLTQGAPACSWPAWSPDETGAAFALAAPGAGGKIGLVDLRSREVTWAAENLAAPLCPAFSPDGKGLIFVAGMPQGQDQAVWRVRVA